MSKTISAQLEEEEIDRLNQIAQIEHIDRSGIGSKIHFEPNSRI